MLETLVSAVAVCAAALLLGQGVLRLCGWRSWSWLAPSVGISVLMLLAVPALHVPGRSTTCAAVIVLACLAALALLVREPALRPPLSGVSAGIWPLLLTVVPFVVAGRSGILGVSISNDMAAHLLLAEAHTDAALTSAVGPSYPLGPHAVVAAVSDPFGIALEHAFSGFTMALPVLLGWTALGAITRTNFVGRSAVVVAVGMPFLVAAYFGQGAFKEVLLAQLVLGVALALASHGRWGGPLRWVPAALMIAGMISVYSYAGMVWPGLLFLVWLAGLGITAWARRGRRAPAWGDLRGEMVPIVVGMAVLAVVLVPQLPRVYRYLKGSGGGTGLAEGTLGNLLGPLPFWQGFGVWDNRDFRMPAVDPLAVGVLVGAILVLAVAAAAWWLRRGEWLMPVAAGICGLIWLYADRGESPYVAAKALVIFTPVMLLVAIRPLVEHPGDAVAVTPWWRLGRPLALAILVYAIVSSSWDALRASPVGPRNHLSQLRELRSSVDGAGVLFLGNDDFIRYALSGAVVQAPFIGAPGVQTRPEKAWQYGQAFDFDSVTAEVYSSVSFVIATRDAAASAPPSQLRLQRTTRDFALYRRVGQVSPRQVLPEGEGPGAVLDCNGDARMRALSRRAGTAVVREGGVAVSAPSLGAGGDRVVDLALPRGDWDLVMSYTSGLPIVVSAQGMAEITMPPNLDRPGPRYPVGRIRVAQAGKVPLRIRVPSHRLASTVAPAVIPSIIAVPVGTARTVPLRRACGQLVDYFTAGPST